MTELDNINSSSSSPAWVQRITETKVKKTFTWRDSGEHVQICGSWSNWKDRVSLSRDEKCYGIVHSVEIELSLGIHNYKFIVDEEWKHDADQQTITESNGIINNCICLTMPEIVETSVAWKEKSEHNLDDFYERQLHHNQFLLDGVEGLFFPSPNDPQSQNILVSTGYLQINSAFHLSKSKSVPSMRARSLTDTEETNDNSTFGMSITENTTCCKESMLRDQSGADKEISNDGFTSSGGDGDEYRNKKFTSNIELPSNGCKYDKTSSSTASTNNTAICPSFVSKSQPLRLKRHESLLVDSFDAFDTQARAQQRQFYRQTHNTTTDGIISCSNSSRKVVEDRRLVVVMVGLPARGKSYVASKMCRYLSWLGHKTKLFNVGSYRRKVLGSRQIHDFFRMDNPEGIKARAMLCKFALGDMEGYLQEGGRVAILDATNHTRDRRKTVEDFIRDMEARNQFQVKSMYVEQICDDRELIEQNIRQKIATSSDYKHMDPKDAERDFRLRIKHYEAHYESMTDKNISYFKNFNGGAQTVTNKIKGVVMTRIIFFVMNLRISAKRMYFSRHGQSEDNTQNKLGGDSNLTEKGQRYAVQLAKFMNSPAYGFEMKSFDPHQSLCVWCSTLNRAVQTAKEIPHVQIIRWKALDEINAGDADGLTYEEFEEKYPEEYARRISDKLNYRFPGRNGESYMDLTARLEPVILELERQELPTLLIAHQAIIRCLMAYFLNLHPSEAVNMEIPLHHVIKMEPSDNGLEKTTIKLL